MSQPIQQLMADALTIEVFADSSALSLGAAARVQSFLAETIGRQGGARVILATGNSQLEFLEELAGLGGVDWPRITCFHMDEYLGMAESHPASFIRYLHERVESRLRPGRFHFLRGDVMEPIAECERYAALLREQPIDLCCLGIGDNGHLAFNDPPVADFDDPLWVKLIQLDEITRKQQAGYGHFAAIDEVPQYGFTLTIPALVSARKLVCLAPGARKAAIVRETVRGPVSEACPASVLRTKPQATLLLDTGSASLLG